MFTRDKYLSRLISLKHNGRVKIVTGIRRCGKSYLLSEIYKKYLLAEGVNEDHIVYISLDDSKNNRFLDPLTLEKHLRNKIKDNKMYYFMLDEIQRVYTIINPIFTNGELQICNDVKDERAFGFQNVVNGIRMIDNADVYITGSNSRFLSKDILTDFRDRGDEIYVQPLSFKEIVDCTNPNDLELAFNEYKLYGGMPVIQSLRDKESKMKYLKDLFMMTYNRDVGERNNLTKTGELDTLTKIMADNIGSLTNASTIENTFNTRENLGLTKNTIKKYLDYLEDAFIIQKVERYDIKGRRHIGAKYKYYFTDIGLRNSRTEYARKDDGHIMENIIYNELVRRGFSIQVGVVNAFDKNKENKTIRKTLETDFVATKGDMTYYIQSAYQIYDETKLEQERRSLINIDDSYKKIIITHERGPIRRDERGITYIDLITFLLNENALEY